MTHQSQNEPPQQAIRDVLRASRDLFTQELIVGGNAGVEPALTSLYNALIGTKLKIVTGYNGTAEIALAMECGEVQGHR